MPSGGDLQGAINSANPGDEIVLQASGSWTGSYALPNKGANSAWIVIRSSALSSLPMPGNRVSPQDAANMPKIMALGTNTAFTLANGANHYRLMGLEITEQPKQYLNYGLIMGGDPNDTNAADLPSYITIDRCYIHGLVLSHIKFGVQMNGSYLAVIDSYLSEFHGIGQDTQAIFGYMGTGPLKIVNNFLEASGENILFGGAWDAIPNTTTADVTFTNNYLYKPPAWRTSTIVPPPNALTAKASTGGSLATGTYYYAVIAQGTAGTLTSPGSCQSSRSNEVAVTLGAGQSAATLQWIEPAYGDSQDTRMADNYVVLRTQDAPKASNRTWTYYVVTPSAGATSISFTDKGTSTQTGYGEWARYWDVKNLFEIKNGVRWLVDSNVMEGNWVNAQNGFSVLFTPRNETPFMPGNRISDITFTNNVIRHVAGGINLASEDDSQPSADWPLQQPTARMAFVNNLFEDVSWAYNGNGNFMEMEEGAHTGMDGAQDILIEHNTSFQTGNYNSISPGGPINNLVFRNNVFGEGGYGWFVSGLGQSYSALTQVFSNLSFTNNVWAADPGPYQIPGNSFPSDLSQVGFVNYNGGNGGDYHLASNSPYKGTATDGTDPGVNMDTLKMVLTNVLAGSNTSAPTNGSTGPVISTPAPATTTPSSPMLWFAIVSVNSGKCLTVTPNATVAQYTCSATNSAQMFSLAPYYDSSQNLVGYEAYSRTGAGLGLNVWGNTSSNGATVGIYKLSGQANEIFRLNPDHAGNFTIIPKNSGSCLDITNVSKTDGALLEQWSCTGGPNQSFDVVMVDSL